MAAKRKASSKSKATQPTSDSNMDPNKLCPGLSINVCARRDVPTCEAQEGFSSRIFESA